MNKFDQKEATLKKLRLFLSGKESLPFVSEVVLNSIIYLLQEEEFEKQEIAETIIKISQNNKHIIEKERQELIKRNKKIYLSLEENDILEEIKNILNDSNVTITPAYKTLRNQYELTNAEILNLSATTATEKVELLKNKIKSMLEIMLDYMYTDYNNDITVTTKVLK